MQNKWLWLVVPGLLIGAGGCPDITADSGEGAAGPTVEFDPANKIVPFPNNLLLDPMTGKVNLPAQCNEGPVATATRTGVLNKLDGFGTYELGMQVTFTEAVDPATLTGNVVLYKRAAGSTDLSPSAATLVPVTTRVGTTTRFDAACSSSAPVDSVTIIPLAPLDQKSTYTGAVLAGVKTATGGDFVASFTWSMVRQAADPVTLADPSCNPGTGSCEIASDRTPLDPRSATDLQTLNGLDLLWKAHAKAMGFLEATGHARADVLLAWDFNTQTVTDPLDPTVPGSPAATIATGPLLGVTSLTCSFDAVTCPRGMDRSVPPFVLCDPAGGGPGTDNNTQCFLKITLGAAAGATGLAIYPTGNATCASLGCAAVGDVIVGGLSSRSYQVDQPAAIPAPTTGPNVGNPNFGGAIPGPWSDPVHPAFVKNNIIQVLAMVPVTAGPYPTVVFGHGFTSSKTTLFGIGSQLAAAGFASASIDFVGHGSRAVRISTDAAIGCADSGTGAAPDPTGTTDPRTVHCYAPLLSADLANTRDGIRQSVLDLHGLVAGLKACGASSCAGLPVDPAHISYTGISLGGIFGTMAVATQPDVQASALNVPGVGWGDLFENTQRNDFRCPLVDALIDVGILTGDKSAVTGTLPRISITSGLCTTDAWKVQPGYAQFASIIRWVLDPADGANFTSKLAPRKFLIQEVVGDTVVPNIATDREAALVGLTAANADPYFPACAAGARAGLGCSSDPQCPSSTCVFPNPSAAIVTNMTANKFIKNTNLPPDGATAFAGNTFWHGSLLKPLGACSTTTTTRCTSSLDCPGVETCSSASDGSLATARLQKDAITYLFFNK